MIGSSSGLEHGRVATPEVEVEYSIARVAKRTLDGEGHRVSIPGPWCCGARSPEGLNQQCH